MEAVWTLLPALLLLSMVILSLQALEEDTSTEEPQATATPIGPVSSDQARRQALTGWPG